jgi:hypothetical protein
MTAVAGAVYTASQYNVFTRDNLLELRATPKYRCSVFRNGAQVVNAGNTDALTLDTEDYDSGAMHDPANPTRITAPAGGMYLIVASTHVSNLTAAATATLLLRANGTTVHRQRQIVPDPGITLYQQPLDITAPLAMNAGEYIEILGQAIGGNVTFGHTTTASLSTWLSIAGPLPPS